MDRRRALAASEEEARLLRGQSISEVTPSRRDFSLYVGTQKQELAVIARLAARTVPAGPDWGREEWVAHARACDDAEVAALAVTTGAGGLSMADLAAVAAATTAPVLRDDLIIDSSQLYHARLHGADAAVVPLAALDDDTVAALIDVAHSLHMAVVIELLGEADMDRTVPLSHVIFGLRCTDTNDVLDLERTRRVAQQLPRHRTTVALAEIRSAAEYAALCGVCDAVVIGTALLGGNIAEALQAITGR